MARIALSSTKFPVVILEVVSCYEMNRLKMEVLIQIIEVLQRELVIYRIIRNQIVLQYVCFLNKI